MSPPNAIDRLRQELRPHQSFQVDFKQLVTQDLFPDQPTTATGSLSFHRPDHFKWVYRTPKPKVISYDGKTLKVDSDVVPQSGGISLEESFAFLWGKVSSKYFIVQNLKTNSFRLRVKNPDKANFKYIDATLKNNRIKEAIVHDHLDGVSRLIFSNWRFR